MISVCIVNWKQADLTLQCLESIFNNSGKEKLEVIVVDNGSHDGSAEQIITAYPQVKLIENDKNVGFGTANNQAVRASSGRVVLFLNNDTLVMPGAIDIMADIVCSDRNVGIVGCSQYVDRDCTIRRRTAYRRFPVLMASVIHQTVLFLKLQDKYPRSRLLKFALMHYADEDHERIIDAAHINGACMMLSRDVLDEVGLFDTNLFLFLEDTDLCRRVKNAGYKVIYTPKAKIVHFGSQSLIASGMGFKPFHFRSKCYYLRKHHGRLMELTFRAMFAIARCIAPRVLNQEYGV